MLVNKQLGAYCKVLSLTFFFLEIHSVSLLELLVVNLNLQLNSVVLIMAGIKSISRFLMRSTAAIYHTQLQIHPMNKMLVVSMVNLKKVALVRKLLKIVEMTNPFF